MGKGMFMLEERRRMINSILNAVNLSTSKGNSISKNKLCAEMSIQFGLTKKKVEEYLADLQSAERIRVFGDEIISISEEEKAKMKLEQDFKKAGL